MIINIADKWGNALKAVSITLLLALFCIFTSPADAAEYPAKSEHEPKIVDVVVCSYNSDCLVALMSDGTVRTAGLELNTRWDQDTIAWIDSWTDIVQLSTMGADLLGLKADGTVVSTIGRTGWNKPEPRFDPNTWTNVKELISSGDSEYYGLTNDGRILVSNDDPIACYGGGGPFMSWTDIQKVCFFAYGEDRGLFGLRNDGTVIAAEDSVLSHYPFSEDLHDVTAIDSSGYVFCALQRDGTIRVAGIDGTFIAEEASRIHDVAQIAVLHQTVLCRLRDGRVVSCHPESFPELTNWDDIVDIQCFGQIAAGLGKDGRIYLTSRDRYYDRYLLLQEEIQHWEDIVRMKVYNAENYTFEPYILGWKSDGTLCAAGIDLSKLP